MRRLLTGIALLMAGTSALATDVATNIERLKQVGPRGEGHREAVAAAKELSQEEPSSLIVILNAMDGSGPLARNWLSGAFEAVAQRAVSQGDGLPVDPLIAYFNDRSHDPYARRLAFEWIARQDNGFAAKVIPESLDDPSSEMRRAAVAAHVETAAGLMQQGDREAATREYQLALSGAGDDDQVQDLAKVLKELGVDVDIIQHRGFVMNWSLIGPFDNKDGKGFDVAYPPESEIDFGKTYPGQMGDVGWKSLSSEKPDGGFDIAQLVAPHKGAIMYAAAEYDSAAAQPVEFRLATPNAWKLWLNGELLFAREEYHRGMFFDQYQVRGELKPGKNQLLLKVCQNEQTEEWAQDWIFQFRVCDLTGRALPPADHRTAQRSSEP